MLIVGVGQRSYEFNIYFWYSVVIMFRCILYTRFFWYKTLQVFGPQKLTSGHPNDNKVGTNEFHDQIIIQIAELDYQLGLSWIQRLIVICFWCFAFVTGAFFNENMLLKRFDFALPFLTKSLTEIHRFSKLVIFKIWADIGRFWENFQRLIWFIVA